MTDRIPTPHPKAEGWARWEAEQMTAFGAAVRRFRQARGLSVRKLAEAHGLSRGLIMNIEHGSRRVTHLPSVTLVLHLAEALEVSPADLIPQLSTVDASQLRVANRRLDGVRRALEVEA